MLKMRQGDCFTRRGAMLSIAPACVDSNGLFHGLHVGRMTKDRNFGGEDDPHGKDLFYIMPEHDGEGFEAFCDPGEMKLMRNDRAIAEVCFPRPDLIRIRSNKLPLRVTGDLEEHEAMIDRLDGTWQLGLFDAMGEMLFYSLRGRGDLISKWNWIHAGTEKIELLFAMGQDEQIDFCIRYGNANVEPAEDLPDFESCVRDVREDFAAWEKSFGLPAEGFEEKHRAAAWHTWNCLVNGQGRLHAEIPMKTIRTSADLPGAAVCAAAMNADPTTAENMIQNILAYQSASGRMPSGLDDINVDFSRPTPATLATALKLCARRIMDPGLKVRIEKIPVLSYEEDGELCRKDPSDEAALTLIQDASLITDDKKRLTAEGLMRAYSVLPLQETARFSQSAAFLLAESLYRNQKQALFEKAGEK